MVYQCGCHVVAKVFHMVFVMLLCGLLGCSQWLSEHFPMVSEVFSVVVVCCLAVPVLVVIGVLPCGFYSVLGGCWCVTRVFQCGC